MSGSVVQKHKKKQVKFSPVLGAKAGENFTVFAPQSPIFAPIREGKWGEDKWSSETPHGAQRKVKKGTGIDTPLSRTQWPEPNLGASLFLGSNDALGWPNLEFVGFSALQLGRGLSKQGFRCCSRTFVCKP